MFIFNHSAYYLWNQLSAAPMLPNSEDSLLTVQTKRCIFIVLIAERARNLFVVNPRMERALQRVSENCSSPVLSSPASTTIANPVNNKPALHGVPASLLEKVFIYLFSSYMSCYVLLVKLLFGGTVKLLTINQQTLGFTSWLIHQKGIGTSCLCSDIT